MGSYKVVIAPQTTFPECDDHKRNYTPVILPTWHGIRVPCDREPGASEKGCCFPHHLLNCRGSLSLNVDAGVAPCLVIEVKLDSCVSLNSSLCSLHLPFIEPLVSTEPPQYAVVSLMQLLKNKVACRMMPSSLLCGTRRRVQGQARLQTGGHLMAWALMRLFAMARLKHHGRADFGSNPPGQEVWSRS